MKTAISIPDALFEQAESFAARRSISRSQLYAVALAEHLRRQTESKVTESFDAAYGDEDDDVDAWGSLGEFRASIARQKNRKPRWQK